MADISTSEHTVACPHCEEPQTLLLDVPIGGSVSSSFICQECGYQFKATVTLVYEVHLKI